MKMCLIKFTLFLLASQFIKIDCFASQQVRPDSNVLCWQKNIYQERYPAKKYKERRFEKIQKNLESRCFNSDKKRGRLIAGVILLGLWFLLSALFTIAFAAATAQEYVGLVIEGYTILFGVISILFLALFIFSIVKLVKYNKQRSKNLN